MLECREGEVEVENINYELLDNAKSNNNLENKETDIENNVEMGQIGTKVKGIEETDESEKDLEDVNCLSDKDFAEHLRKTFCGRSRPAKYSSQQESVSDELGDGRNLDES